MVNIFSTFSIIIDYYEILTFLINEHKSRWIPKFQMSSISIPTSPVIITTFSEGLFSSMKAQVFWKQNKESLWL